MKLQGQLKQVITEIGKEYPNVWFLQKVTLFVQNHFHHSNTDALIHALNSLLIAKRNGLTIANPQQYCSAVLRVENGNYNERENINRHEQIKKATGFTSIGELFADMPQQVK